MCARMCRGGGGGGCGGPFTFLRSVVYQTNLLRALAGYNKVYCVCFHADFLQAMLLFIFPFVVVVPCRLFVCLFVVAWKLVDLCSVAAC